MKVALYNYGELVIGRLLTVAINLIEMFNSIGWRVDCYTFVHSQFQHGLKFKKFTDVHFRKFNFKKESCNEIIKKLSQYDLVILLQPPTTKGELLDYKTFLNIYQSLDTKTWFQYHNTPKIRYFFDIIAGSDVVSTYDNEFSELAQICRLIKKETHKLINHCNFNKFYKVFNNKKINSIAHIGRGANYKGSLQFLRIAPYFIDRNIDLSYIGLGEGKVGLSIIYNNAIKENNISIIKNYFPTDINDLFGNLMFNFNPTYIKGCSYGDRFEFSQIEPIACGVIPVLHRNQGANCQTKGKYWIEIPYFAIWFEETKVAECAEEIVKVLNNETLQRKYRGTALEVVKDSLDVKNFKRYIEEVMGKPSGKINMGNLLFRANWSKEQINGFIQLSKRNILKQRFDNLLNRKIEVIV